MIPNSADLLREHGINATAQRLAVFRAVNSSAHITADHVIDFAEAEIGTISRQAVYDALGVFVEKGLIRRIQPVGSPALYENRVDDNHHHVICRICGAVADVDCAVGSTPCLEAANNMGYEIDEAEVAYWGRCPTCQAKGRTATPFETPYGKRRHDIEQPRTSQQHTVTNPHGDPTHQE